MESKASAVWEGGLKDGAGRLTSKSSMLSNTPYSFGTRFEGAAGTNPEELIAAAHAGCYAMALSKILADSGMTPERIATEATVTLAQKDGGFAITRSHLDVRVRAKGGDESAFQEAAAKAKAGCPVSKLMTAEITMDARLEG